MAAGGVIEMFRGRSSRGVPVPVIEPLPPVVGGAAAAIGLLRDPTSFLSAQRRRLGDLFVVDAFGHRLCCTFSPEGVQQLYGFPEHKASFGLATYTLIKAKVPEELFVGRRNTPHSLFGRQETESYLDGLEEAMTMQLAELGASGDVELFALSRRIGHRLGLGSWGGMEAASPAMLDELIPLFDRLDSSEAFVRPSAMLFTNVTGKHFEREAMHGIEAVFGRILAARRASDRDRSGPNGDFLDQIAASFADAEMSQSERDVQAARDLILIHMGSQSNLFAALAWTLVNLLLHPRVLEGVRDGDDELLERTAYESTRLAQRSITLRQVLRPVDITTGGTTYRLSPGVMLTTMLSVTNTTSAPGLDRFDPAHYHGRRLVAGPALATKELVSTFGHGIHTCPAQRFSISAIRIAVRRLIDAYDFTTGFATAQARRRQIGGVARAAKPCPVTYRAR